MADPGYQRAFLNLSRNLAPSGKAFSSVEIRSMDDPRPVVLIPETRTAIGKAIRAKKEKKPEEIGAESDALDGVLRALNLDKDWLEVTVEGKNVRVHGLYEAMDDVIGPMVNHEVRVKTYLKGGKHVFVDIESDE